MEKWKCLTRFSVVTKCRYLWLSAAPRRDQAWWSSFSSRGMDSSSFLDRTLTVSPPHKSRLVRKNWARSPRSGDLCLPQLPRPHQGLSSLLSRKLRWPGSSVGRRGLPGRSMKSGDRRLGWPSTAAPCEPGILGRWRMLRSLSFLICKMGVWPGAFVKVEWRSAWVI